MIDITNGEQSDWLYPVNPLDNGFFYPSPDLIYAIKGSNVPSIFSIQTNQLVMDYTDLNLDRSMPVIGIEWSPNSDMAIVTSRTEDANSFEITNYLLIGFYINSEDLFKITIPIDEYQRTPEVAISPDSRYIAYFYETLHIADLQTRSITNTCITNDLFFSLMWSPDGSQVAYTQRGRGNQPINIYDLSNDAVYTVQYYEANEVIGWRAD